MLKKILDLLKNNYWIKSGSITVVNRLLVSFLGLLSFIILIRILNKDDYGIWVLFITITSLIEASRNALISIPLVAKIAGTTSSKNSLFVKETNASLQLNISSFFIIAIILYFTSSVISKIWDAERLNNLIYIYIITSFFLSLLIHFNVIQQAAYRFTGILISNLSRKLSFLLLIILLFIFEMNVSLISLVYIDLFSVLFSTIITFFITRKYLIIKFKILFENVYKHFVIGIFSFGTNISSMIFKSMDKWMLGALLSPVAVALYDPAIRIANLFEVPLSGISNIYFPKLAEEIKAKGKHVTKYFFEKSVGVLMAVITPFIIIAIFLSEIIIYLIAGDGFTESSAVLKITLLYGLIIPFYRQYGITLMALKETKLNFYTTIFTVVLNIVFNYIFINEFGVIGAAYGTLSAYLLSLILLIIILYKKLEIELSNILKYSLNFYSDIFKRIL